MARPRDATEGRLTFGKIVRSLNGLPGIILAGLAALAAFQAYVHKREELAVARAEWRQERDRLRNQIVAESLAAGTRERARQDSITHLNARLTVAVTTAASEGRRAGVFHDALHELVDSNAAAKAALDSLESHHAGQVLSLERAVAISDSLLKVERAGTADRDAQIATLRMNLANAITRADGFERQAHPGAIKRILDSPVTHLVALGVGYAMGAK